MKRRIREKIVKKKVAKLMKKFARDYAGKTLYPIDDPVIRFNVSMNGNEAGFCVYVHNEKDTVGMLLFNGPSLKANWHKFLKAVIPHEVAHWCHALLYGPKDGKDNETHGEKWSMLAEYFGGEVAAAENPAPWIAKKMPDHFLYKCKCSQINLSAEEVEKINGSDGWWCEECDEELKAI